MPNVRSLVARATLLVVALAVPVYPCGGPEHYDIDAPLATADAYLQAVETVDDFDFRPRPELRFLHPFMASGVARASAMWTHAYADAAWNTPAALDTTAAYTLVEPVGAFERAAQRGDASALSVAARALLNEALAVPAVVADEFQLPVRRAVEALELLSAPGLAAAMTPALVQRLYDSNRPSGGEASQLPAWAQEALALRALPRDSMPGWGDTHPGSPRLGSLRFVGLQLAMKRGIPDGWAREIRDSVPPARWREFAAMHDDWMRRFADHPLAPWVTLSRIRLAYFAGDTATAWNVALGLYGVHTPRAVEEMRFLLRQSFYPPSLDDPRIDDVLRSALLGEVPIEGARWRTEWERAQRVNAPWAVAARDRLMWRAARDSGNSLRLPANALEVPASSLSPIGGVLRLVALIRAGRVRDAIARVDSLGSDSPGSDSPGSDSLVAPMKVQLLLAAHRWRDALAAPGIQGESRAYLVRVLAPDSVLASLAAGGGGTLSTEAQRTLATRAAAAGDWRAAADRLPPREASRRTLWRGTQALAADTSLGGRLAFARHMRARNGKLFWGNDKVWYRSLNWRLASITDTVSQGFNPILPWTSDEEVRAIGRHFRDGFEMYHAVRAYTDFLSRAPRTDVRRAAALREANQTYNWLVNWDNNNSRFWEQALEQEGIGPAIRRAGRR